MSHKTILFLLLLISFSIQAQYKIDGNIVDELNKPLNGCHVHIGNSTQNTNPDGSFLIVNVPSGRKKLYVSYIGYKSIDTTLVVSGNIRLNLKLKKEITQLNEVVFHKKANAINESVLEQKIQLGTIEKYSNQTLGEALREVAGVSLLRTGSSIIKPIINGLHSSRVPIINNNVRLEDQQWGTEHAPNFDINAAGKITVIKGASALQYGGDAVGGLIVIDPVVVKKDTLYGKTIINSATNGQGGSISTSLHKGNFCDWSWNVQGTFKYMGDRESPDYVLSNTGNREANFSGDIKYMGKKYDISAYYSYYNATIGILSASHIGSSSDLYNSINNKVPFVIKPFTHTIGNPKQEVQHHLAKINYNWYSEENTSLGIQYAFQLNNRLEFDIRRGEFANTAALDLELITHSLQFDYKKAITDWTFKTGISTSYQNNFANPKTGVRPLIPTYDKIDLGAYGIAEYTMAEGFTLDMGLRYDFSNIQATKAYYKLRWTETGYSPGFDRFIIGEEGNQWITKPEFTFHNISASLGFHKTFYHNWD
ncbi:MAG TPA: carboxypeptidase-like regulatory domain-containing protein, partial [Flavobacterium sp.]